MEKIKENFNKLYAIADEIREEIYKIVDNTPKKFIDLQDDKCDTIYGYNFGEMSTEEEKVIGIAIFDGELCVFLEPISDGYSIIYTDDEMLNGDNWETLNNKSDVVYLQTIANIAELLHEYIK